MIKKFIKKLFGLKEYKHTYLRDIKQTIYDSDTGRTIRTLYSPAFSKIDVSTNEIVEIYSKVFEVEIICYYSVEEYKKTAKFVEIDRKHM